MSEENKEHTDTPFPRSNLNLIEISEGQVPDHSTEITRGILARLGPYVPPPPPEDLDVRIKFGPVEVENRAIYTGE